MAGVGDREKRKTWKKNDSQTIISPTKKRIQIDTKTKSPKLSKSPKRKNFDRKLSLKQLETSIK